MKIKNNKTRALVFSLLCGAPFTIARVQAKEVEIVKIPNPQFTEVQQVSDGSWHVVKDLGSPHFPLRGKQKEGSNSILIRLKGGTYKIFRADVKLSNEHIVTSACDTVPVSINKDSRSASVKGAGESCN